MTEEERTLTRQLFILYYIEKNMTEEKMQEIESRSRFRLRLIRNWFKNFDEYKKFCEDKSIPEITREKVIELYLSNNEN